MTAAMLTRTGAIIALALSYVLLAHYTMTTPGNESLGLLIALAPLALAALSAAWHSPWRVVLLGLLALGAMGLLLYWDALQHQYSRVYWIEHAGTQLALGLMFARTLGTGREPLCSYFARTVHGFLTPEMQRYTRQVTIAWVIFFGMMSATSTLIFLAAPLPVWSTFANFFTAPLTCLMFVAEYAVRRKRHPDMAHAHFLASAKAFWNAPAQH